MLPLLFILFGCSNPQDTVKPKQSFAQINEAASKINYVFADGIPVEMKEGDNYKLLQSIIDKKTGTYVLPPGRFLISKTLKFDNSSVVLVGSPTTLDFYPGVDGMEITNGGPTIARMGIKVHAVVKLIEVWVHGFGGSGISVTADIASSATNASHSQILFCTASECGGDGLYFHGGDANACNVIGFDSRDNKGWGINDDSFLGNTFINAMCHSNAKGHYRSENGNNRTVFVGCYGEEDSPPSMLGGVTRWYGGLLGYEVTPDKKYYKGTTTRYRGSGGYIITSAHAKIDTQ
jgi:hypothetical protein